MMRLLLAMPLSLLAGCSRAFIAPPPAPSGAKGYTIMSPTGFDPSPLLAWASWLGLAGVLILVFIAIAVPVYKKTMFGLAAAAAGMVAAAYVMGHIMAWMPILSLIAAIAVLVLVALGLSFLAWQLWLRLRAAIKSGEIMQKHAVFSDWKEVKADLIAIQGGEKSKVQQDIDKLCHKVREE